jgi:hypothetical protein
MASTEIGTPVQLYVYDLSNGLASAMSQMILGRQIEGVWHTAIVFGGVEYFFGQGVQQAVPKTTHYGFPVRVIDLGHTQLPADIRNELLTDLKSQKYNMLAYHPLQNNCNHFTNDFANVLIGEGIPDYILNQVQEIMSTPMGQMIVNMMTQAVAAQQASGPNMMAPGP